MRSYRSLSCIIIFLSACNVLMAQVPVTTVSWLSDIPDAANNILYSSSRKLSIDDFKGVPDGSSDAAAITSSGFMFTAKFHSKGNAATLNIGVYCSFNKKESWMKENGKTAYVLEHEQRHFDISYLGTLLFIKKVKAAKFSVDNYMDRLTSIYKQVADDMRKMQDKYDAETINGINKEKQAEWNDKINDLLNNAEEVK